MFIHIQSFILDARRNTQAVQFLDTIEEDDATGSCPEVYDKYAKRFGSEEAPAVTVESSVAYRQQTSHQCSENTTNTVNTGGTNGIVNVEFVINELNAENQHCAADETDDDSTHG